MSLFVEFGTIYDVHTSNVHIVNSTCLTSAARKSLISPCKKKPNPEGTGEEKRRTEPGTLLPQEEETVYTL
ncbi:hypothetical protein Mp_2g12770 [Marchantia polymorpha subsp. ruderalis]|uniref:Uncharacterized protein n=1 Tax=Marchantia polymorpha TaxID=3197 RepID=A0A2R6XAT0_MARPO|nr:hypothetical protein MARPO_0026s0094 [Marchantia polymorpha]BBN02098.1 hypothetical protein Mp_2g12770 [Marchantia polymorpha subsp. ruderalis]|eukprot:PTQ43221.1 hypothetical protein MARPO_0026s0094 [Marchantia polymorpha]